jgi:hypothetical protein
MQQFKTAEIEAHVNQCLNEDVVDNRAELIKSDPNDDVEVAKEDAKQYIEDQQRHFALWMKRRQEEDEDRKLAAKLALQPAAAVASSSSSSASGASFAPPQPSAPALVSEDADEKLARELQEREK